MKAVAAAFLLLACALASGAGLLISGIAPYVGWSAFLCMVCLLGTAVSLIAAGSAHERRSLQKSRQVLVLPPAQDPEPDDLAEYSPAGQCELSRELLRLMQAQVEEAASRWDALRDPLPGYRWNMSPEWLTEVLKLNQPPSEPVEVSEEYGVPELVIAPKPAPAPQPPPDRAVALLDEAVRSYKEKTILGVLPEDQAEAAALLEQHDRAYRMIGTLVNKPLVLGSEALAMYDGLRAELDAVSARLKGLRFRYEVARPVEMNEVRAVQSYGVPPAATAPLSSAGGLIREVPHHCNGKYYANVAYCPQHGG
jgi:hypothetical protein